MTNLKKSDKTFSLHNDVFCNKFLSLEVIGEMRFSYQRWIVQFKKRKGLNEYLLKWTILAAQICSYSFTVATLMLGV